MLMYDARAFVYNIQIKKYYLINRDINEAWNIFLFYFIRSQEK